VLGNKSLKPLQIQQISLQKTQKIIKNIFKNPLHYKVQIYIIQRLVKREEAGSYRAIG